MFHGFNIGIQSFKILVRITHFLLNTVYYLYDLKQEYRVFKKQLVGTYIDVLPCPEKQYWVPVHGEVTESSSKQAYVVMPALQVCLASFENWTCLETKNIDASLRMEAELGGKRNSRAQWWKNVSLCSPHSCKEIICGMPSNKFTKAM